MKKTKLLLVLASSTLLTACFNFGGGLKKVEFDEFATGLISAVKNNEFAKKGAITSSKEGKIKGKIEIAQSLTSGSNTTSMGSTGYEITLDAKADINSQILYVEMEMKMSTEQQSASQKMKYQIQKGTDGNFVFIDIFKKAYSTSEIKDFNFFLDYVPGIIGEIDFDKYLSELKENEQFKKFSDYFTFSMNDKQFSIELDGEHEVKEDDKLIGKIKSNKSKIFVDLTDGNESATANVDLVLSEIAQEEGMAGFGNGTYSYKAGDSFDITVKGEGTLSIANADLSLTAVDISSFAH